MRLVTLNTWGMRGNWAARLPVFREGFLALDADIVTLQETILTDRADQGLTSVSDHYGLVVELDPPSAHRGPDSKAP